MINFIHFWRLIEPKGSGLVAQMLEEPQFQDKDLRLFVFGKGKLEAKFRPYKFDIPSKYISHDPMIISTFKDMPYQLKDDINWLKSHINLFKKEGGLVEFADTDVLGFEVEDNKKHFISKYGEEIYTQILDIHSRWHSKLILIDSKLWQDQKLGELTSHINTYLAQPWYYLIPIFEDKRIYYFGWQPFEVITKWLDISDMTLMPSVFLETFGLSALESLARGVPVVAPSKGGLQPFVLPQLDLGSDWQGESEKFFEIISQLLNWKIRITPLKAKSLEIAKNYDISNWLKKFEKIVFES